MSTRQFPRAVLRAIRDGKIFGIRAGLSSHRFLGIWAVLVGNRAFVRTWNDKPGGWYREFLTDPRGTLQLPSGRELRVRARHVRGDRLLDEVDRAYAAKYNTQASLKFVRGFATARRRAKTLALALR